MSVCVSITDGPLPPASGASCDAGPRGTGAAVAFEGIVRPTEAGEPLAALVYEAYEPMASRQLAALAQEMLDRHGLLEIRVEHSRGRVPAGARSFRLTIHARHRREALAAMGEFIDRMKRDVPIWKHAEPATR